MGADAFSQYSNQGKFIQQQLLEMETLLKILPQFRQLRLIRRHGVEDNYLDSTDKELHKVEEEEGEEDANEYVKENGSALASLDPKELLRHATNTIEDIANQATSLGINDFTGYDSLKAKMKAKAEANIALAMGFDPGTAAYISGETPKEVNNEIQDDKKKEAASEE